MIQSVINQWGKKAGHTVGTTRLCRLLGVSRSGVYAARSRAQQVRMACPVTAALQRIHADSGATYGSRRLSAALKAQGHAAGRYRVRGLMREHGIRACWQRKFIHTTDSRHDLPVAQNHLNR